MLELSARIAAATAMGSVAFLEPLTEIVPSSCLPPLMISLSMMNSP